ncbi:MAG: metal-dependent transcriptional regulator [Clostridia bacterium]
MDRHESTENYLETILVLTEKLGKVRSIDIVNDMNFTKPSVSIAMKNFREKGYITMDESGYITLTNIGEKIAKGVLERHRVITKALLSIGVSNETAVDDACRIEHDISEETFLKIKALIK